MKNKLRLLLLLVVIPTVASSSDLVTKDEQRCSDTFGSQKISTDTRFRVVSKTDPSTMQPSNFTPLRLPTPAPALPFQQKKKKVRLIKKNEPITLRKVVREVAIGLGIVVGVLISLPLFVYLVGV